MKLKSTFLLFACCFTFALRAQTVTLAANPTQNNGSGGIFFSITTNTSAINFTAVNTFFSSTAGTPVSVEVYTLTGPYTGLTASAASWTLLGTVNTTSAGTGALAPIDLTGFGIQIPASTTQSFYCHATTTGGGIRYAGTTLNPSVKTFSDADVTLFTDVSRTGIVAFAGTQFANRSLAGNIEYSIAPLPVKWISVSGNTQNKTAVISWEVSEKQVLNYELQKLVGGEYRTVSTTASRGDGQHSYEAADATAFNESSTAIYRIKQTDIDGKTSYSAAVMVKSVGTNTQLAAHPNPFANQVYITVANTTTAVVTDVAGKIIVTLQLQAGDNAVNTAQWLPGIYTITCNEEVMRLQKY